MLTLMVIGAGNRGMEVYAPYSKLYPEEIQIVGVAEPMPEKRERFVHEYGIPKERAYTSWEEALKGEKFADAVIIATQDTMHYKPAMRALKLGYHVLLEKPISNKLDELISLRDQAKKSGKILSVAHVLRYSDIFNRIKSILDSGTLGTIQSIQHQENIGYWHYAHSFVRGPWRNASQSNPIILAKACHDMDLLVWYANSKCKSVASFGSRRHFTQDQKPKGAPAYCTQGCPHGETCIFNSQKIYAMDRAANLAKIVKNENGTLEEGLKSSNYGRCVYDLDSDVMETQVTILEFQNGITATFHLSAFTDEISRYIHIMGTKGELRANTLDRIIQVTRFDTGHTELIPFSVADSGHEGGDFGIIKAFIQEIHSDNQQESRTSIEKSIDSHIIALAAEHARITNRVVDIKEFERFRGSK